MTHHLHFVIVDDDAQIRTLLSTFLRQEGLRITALADGRSLPHVLGTAHVDLVVLDIMLPHRDGLQLCREIREARDVPIIMLTAKGDEADRIVGLELGADDYMSKPFSPRELLARARAVLRRAESKSKRRRADRRLAFDGWCIDLARRELRNADGALVSLTGAEFDLLAIFVENPQLVLSRDHLIERARGRIGSSTDRTIDVLVSRLRRKIEPDLTRPVIIKTVRNSGYIFSADVQSAAASAEFGS